VKIGQVVATIDTAATAGSAEPKEPATPTGEIATPYASAAKDVPQSPAVRRLAGETGIDPAGVSGSGKAGRVTKGDMLVASTAKPSDVKAPAVGPAAVSPVIAPSPTLRKEERQTRRKMSPLRAKIAKCSLKVSVAKTWSMPESCLTISASSAARTFPSPLSRASLRCGKYT
jgi:2-oxoglutarate dehydrogenase E2 component (dihydrolipoamide succinyltransferase)